MVPDPVHDHRQLGAGARERPDLVPACLADLDQKRQTAFLQSLEHGGNRRQAKRVSVQFGEEAHGAEAVLDGAVKNGRQVVELA